MAAWTNPTTTTAGVLRAEEFARHVRLQRVGCSPVVAPWVENYWILHWDLPVRTQFVSQVVPHPSCSLTAEHGHTRDEISDDPVVITGVVTTRFDAVVRGRGWVWGVKFRPGGLAALTGQSARPWRDRVLPAADVLPIDLINAMRDLADDDPLDQQVGAVDAALAHIRPAEEDPRYDEVLHIIATMLADRSLVSVAQVEDRCGMPVRTMQRVFEHYLGVGPKWVLARYRIHDVLTALDAGYDGSLTELALLYGWYDQAHFTRDFTATAGVSPGAYRARETLG